VKQMLEDNGRCSASGRSRSMDSFDFARLCRLLACEASLSPRGNKKRDTSYDQMTFKIVLFLFL
jgi:hypothetical protein